MNRSPKTMNLSNTNKISALKNVLHLLPLSNRNLVAVKRVSKAGTRNVRAPNYKECKETQRTSILRIMKKEQIPWTWVVY